MSLHPATFPTTDEQLGSPAWSFEQGVLIGLSLGVLVIAIVTRARSTGRTQGPSPS